MWQFLGTTHIVVIISKCYVQVSNQNHHIIKPSQCYLSIISPIKAGKILLIYKSIAVVHERISINEKKHLPLIKKSLKLNFSLEEEDFFCAWICDKTEDKRARFIDTHIHNTYIYIKHMHIYILV